MRWERVRTDAGWHLRLRAANGEVIMTSEVYVRGDTADEALRLVLESTTGQPSTYVLANLETVDERTPAP
jgi:uncharacterized protein YegP (UPF0339 family)